MSDKGRFSGGDIVAIILSITLSITLLVTVIAITVFNKDLSETGARLLTTIGAGMVGALSVYIGRALSRNGKHSPNDKE